MTTTRQRILAEATAQVLATGYASFTVAGVRDALGLSSGSMFHAFGSKAELVGAVYVEGMRDYQAAAIGALTSVDGAEGAIGAWIEAHLVWVGAHRPLARFLFSTQPPEVIEASAAALGEANAEFDKAVDDVVDAAIDDGLLASGARDLARSLIMGPTQEYCRQWARGARSAPPEHHAATFVRAALAAMAATGEPT